MKAEVSYSGNVKIGYARAPYVSISIMPENELEKAILRVAYSGKRKVNVWESGEAELLIQMPRGKND